MNTNPNPKFVKRSTRNGEPATCTVYKTVNGSFGPVEVPSFVLVPGASINEGAKALGLRALGRREPNDLAVAELHERGGKSYLLAEV